MIQVLFVDLLLKDKHFNMFLLKRCPPPPSGLLRLVTQVFVRSFSSNLSNVRSRWVFVNPTLGSLQAFFLCDAYHVIYGKQKLKRFVSDRSTFIRKS